jgi:histidine triad (HIT) family protein|tara:strand:+ start:1415 stop:1813 length:399 start_codon:yes stop_codon:yes gene_type:complete
VTVFEKIVAGEIPCYKIAETDEFLAFLDVSPIKEGHVLVIPKVAVDYIFDLDDDMYSGLTLFAKKVANAIDASIPCERVGVAVVGLEVPHAHIHLIPIHEVGDVSFANPKLNLSPERMTEIAKTISSAFQLA